VDDERTVQVGHEGAVLEFHKPVPAQAQAESVVATLVLPGLTASRLVYLDDAGGGLPEFFGELAVDWRGWDGPRGWNSREDDLRLTCHHDRIGHVVIEVTLDRLPPHEWHRPGWTATASVVVDPGALQVIAVALHHLLIEA
jgi:hypothetical protein